MRHYLKRLLIVGLLLLSSFQAIASSRSSIDVIAVEYPPFITSNEKNYGFTFQLLTKYAESNFVQPVQPLFLPPGRAQKVIESGKWCLSFYPPIDVENRYFLELSEQKVRLNLYRLKQSGEFDRQRLGELKDKSIATLRTNLTGQIAQKYVEAGMIVVPVESLAQGLEMLLRNRVDYWAATDFVLEGLDVTDETRNKLQFADTAIHEFQLGIFYNPQCTDTLFK